MRPLVAYVPLSVRAQQNRRTDRVAVWVVDLDGPGSATGRGTFGEHTWACAVVPDVRMLNILNVLNVRLPRDSIDAASRCHHCSSLLVLSAQFASDGTCTRGFILSACNRKMLGYGGWSLGLRPPTKKIPRTPTIT